MSLSAPLPTASSDTSPRPPSAAVAESETAPYAQGFFQRFLFGPPIETRHQEETHLPKRLALPIFASDAISSVAYATQEILLALGAAGYAAASYSHLYGQYLWGVTLSIVVLLCIVVFSYRQTIFAYPKGGGSYIVTKDNLGAKPGLVAAAALLIDYVLTVSVSIAAGTQNLLSTPLLARLHLSAEGVCLFFIALLVLANLRGLKESGKLFALPTYIFIGLAYLMLGVGLIGPLLGWQLHLDALDKVVPDATHPSAGTTGLGALGILVAVRAFANGCSAMTGTEAISDGIPAFKKPQSQNAATTLSWMAVILATLFLGISTLAANLHVMYGAHGPHNSSPAVIDQISGAVFGRTGPFSFFYYAVQFATGAILVLAANTSFVDFPRLASILANDRYLPKELAHRGDRLVFGRGIVLLGFFAALLILLFQGSVDRLIPLYALGVFTAFTLSQTAMVRRWQKERGAGWQAKMVINGVGAVATFIVFTVILIEKAPEGAWAVVVVAGILTVFFNAVHKRYEVRQRGLAFADSPISAAEMGTNEHGPGTSASIADGSHANWKNTSPIVTAATPSLNGTFVRASGTTPIIRNLPGAPTRNTVIVLVPGIHKGIIPAINYARLIGRDIRPVYIEIDPELTDGIRAEWRKHIPDIPLIVKESPYRSLVQPLLTYIDKVTDEFDDDVVTLIIPESFSGNLLDTLLRSTAATQIKLALLGREDVVVTNVRYRLAD